jgi:hypothetical protein
MNSVYRQCFGLALLIALSAASANACQESCHWLALKPGQIKLMDSEGEPVRHARLIVRTAAAEARKGRRMFCGREIGEIILRRKTDANGHFNLKNLPEGFYWVSYDDAEAGESFLIELNKNSDSTPELELRNLDGLCYLVDIEHDTTRPPGRKSPIYIKE